MLGKNIIITIHLLCFVTLVLIGSCFMAKKNKIKKGPDEELVPQQFNELNEEFYKDYFSEYFTIKFAITANLINQSEKMLEIINNPQNNVIFGELKVDPFKIKKEELIKFGKLELSTMYYHCIETFLRLFLAHVTIPQCPWLEIGREINYGKFKEKVTYLAEGNFDFGNTDWYVDESVSYVFTGFKKLPNTVNSSEIINSLKEWIKWAAKELLEVYEYNTYKHGLAVFTDKRGFTLRDPDNIKMEEHEESLKIIHKHKKGDRWIWKEKVIFTRFDFRSTCILVLQKLISNIIPSVNLLILMRNLTE
jgi:hypothetical protein